MIFAFSRALEAALQARGFPYRVDYHPYLDTKATYRAGIIVTRSERVNERVGASIGRRRGYVLVRDLSADVYVFAKSSKPGARENDHQDECDNVVDGVLTAADTLVRGNGATDFEVPEARFLSADERSALGGFVEQWPGVVYFCRIIVPHGVNRLNYKGQGPATGEVGEVDTTYDAATGATAETVGTVAATGG